MDLFDPSKINPERIIAQSKLLNLKDNIPVIIMAARPVMWKGYQVLIRALSKVKYDFQCVLIWAADGNEKFQKTLIKKIIHSKLN